MGVHSAGRNGWTIPVGGRDRLAAARAGQDPAVIAKLRSGYVALSEAQFLPGYCLLIADADDIEHLTDLDRSARSQFFADLGLLGEALMAACAAWDPAFTRLDYEILGTGVRQLQAHVVARYAWEPVELRDGPVWRHPPGRWRDPAHALGTQHDRLVESITRELSRAMGDGYGAGPHDNGHPR